MTERLNDYREEVEPSEEEGRVDANGAASTNSARRGSCLARFRRKRQVRPPKSLSEQFEDSAGIELAELTETLVDRRSKRRDREKDKRLDRGERVVRIVLFAIASLALIYVLLEYAHSAPLVAGGLGVGGGVALVRHHLQKRKRK